MISVIVPIYNVEKYLPVCIESILNQTYHDIEVILIDDGSSDSCPQICREYKKKDSRVKYIQKENGGQSSARNAGLDICQGDYISFIDGDDFIHPAMLETMHNIIKDKDDCIVACNAKYYYDHEEMVFGPVKPHSAERQVGDLITCIFGYGNTILWGGSSCTKLFPKDLIGAKRFRKLSAEDCVFNVEVALDKCKQIITTNNIFYYYRQRTDSTTSRWRRNVNKVYIDINRSWAFLLKEIIPQDKEQWRSIVLTNMYKKMIDTRYYAKKYDHVENGVKIKAYAEQTVSEIHGIFGPEFRHNKHIPLSTKTKCLFFLHFPLAYEWFIKATNLKSGKKQKSKK